jgi:hypothetical protein
VLVALTEKEAERRGFYPTVPRCCIGHQGGPQIRALAIIVGGCIGEQPSCTPVGVIQVFLGSAITLFRGELVEFGQLASTFGRGLTYRPLCTGLGKPQNGPKWSAIKIPRSPRSPCGARTLQASQQAEEGEKSEEIIRLDPPQTVPMQGLAHSGTA